MTRRARLLPGDVRVDPHWGWASLLAPRRKLACDIIIHARSRSMRCYIAFLFVESFDRYRLELPDFPGCMGWAATLTDAPRVASQVLVVEIALRRAGGLALPRPSAPDALAADAALANALPLVVAASIPVEESANVSVELPAGLVERMDRRAISHGVDRSALLAKAARLALWETGRIEHDARIRPRN